ncbi:MAG: hypothetical protein NWT00_09455, partial [Beijerinckiaceae bacterium]|nr:hypothetical protein [Beijerinckiaceae bacterium]
MRDQTARSDGAPWGAGDASHARAHGEDLAHDQIGMILRDGRSRRRYWRWLSILLSPVLIITLIAAGGYLYLENRLASGPVELSSLGPRIAASMSERAGEGYKFSIGKASLQKESGRPSIIIDRLSLTGPDRSTILSAPKAIVSLDWIALLSGSVLLKRLAVAGLDLHVTVKPGGALDITAGASVPAVLDVATKPIVPVPLRPTSVPGSAAKLPQVTAPGAAASSNGASYGKVLARTLNTIFDLKVRHQALGSLRHIGITRGRLIFNDPSRGRKTIFGGLEMDIAHSGTSVTLDVSAEGSRGRWRVTSSADKGPSFDVRAQVKNVTLDELSLVTGARNPRLDFNNVLAGDIRFQLSGDGSVSSASASVSAGPGILVLPDKDFEPLVIDALSGDFRWDTKNRTMVVRSLQYHGGASKLEFKGALRFGDAAAPSWDINLETAGPAHVAHQTINEASVALEKVKLAISIEPQNKRAMVRQIMVAAKDFHLLLSGQFDYAAGNRRMSLTGQIDPAPVETVKSIWPAYLAPPVRVWVMSNLYGGMLNRLRVRMMLDEQAFAAMAARRPLPDNSTDITYSLSGVTLHYLKGAKPLSKVHANGRARGPVNAITIQSAIADVGDRKALRLSAGTLNIHDQGLGVLKSTLKFRMLGSIGDLSTLLDQPGLAAFKGKDLDLENMQGNLDAKLDMSFLMSRKKMDPEFVFAAKAKLTSLIIEEFAGEAPLKNGRLDLAIRDGGLTASGTGELFAAPVRLKMVKPAGRPMTGTLDLVLDDAARKQMGWD